MTELTTLPTNQSKRENWDSYFVRLAVMAGSRSTCLRRKVGAILVQEHSIKGTAYNGAPSGIKGCSEAGECMVHDGHCVRTVHAETNLILQTDADDRKGATVYCTDRPCWGCALVLANSGVKKIYYVRPYWHFQEQFDKLMKDAGIEVEVYAPKNAADITVAEVEQYLGQAVNHAGLAHSH